MKKIFIILIILFTLLSRLSYTCPNKEVHNIIQGLIDKKSGLVTIEGKNLVVDGELLSMAGIIIYGFEKEKTVEFISDIMKGFELYAKSHNLNLITKNKEILEEFDKKSGDEVLKEFTIVIGGRTYTINEKNKNYSEILEIF